jgi:hypothetical protein
MASAAAQQTSAVQAQAATLKSWLTYAGVNPWTQLATFATGSPGGPGTGVATLTPSDIPETPSWCSAIDYLITLNLSVVVPAAGSFTWSPFFPYSSVLQALTLAGAPPWNLLELTPWYLDQITNTHDFDTGYAGLGQNSPTTAASDPAQDDGGLYTLNSIVPGATITNVGTVQETLTYSVVFSVRQRLQRRRHLGFGLIPFGDPQNRPQQKLQLAPFIGINPEQSAIVNASSGVTCVTTAGSGASIVYELKGLDVLPPQITATPSPTAGMGLQVDSNSPSFQNAGSIQYIAKRTAMLYESMHQLVINNELPIRADYFGLWLTQVQQNARWAYDAQANTFSQYYLDMHRRYHRYLPKGHFLADLASGDIPDFPNASPYQAMMTPDVGLAASMGIAPTPAMSTAIRYPSGTSMSGAYVRCYDFGYVPVPY